MARWISLCFILLLFLFTNLTAMILVDQRIPYKRHIGSAREKLFRAKQLPTNTDNLFQRPKQSLPSPEFLRSRWLELYNERNKVAEPIIVVS
ncbi:unnamed protein product [Adineta ricciae]|uniref:Uncharacterized protein n=1 Tax=Adineta ricciae TaxID=249248 RepID=A0A814BE11_ADIRI|nr:unnamed protein product [Adineta ricciae]